ncbi:uncharacterized protein PV09_02589 [Verruconis gallopava]|uniref:Zn(2)-C6 fungal-type domain-containing protein n=1 Tax=Verruconis gallopava TaxID=253628 RepID=A0A0D2AK34_9PEZI|nr:uncharacterized protein PV09_02589 [Verruconis gallopava]KIW06920.1 hypothetical protein PV09_02589 [Verruconis gallopava]
MTTSRPPACRICRLPFSRNILSQHNECCFCGRVFRRVDGAKRHVKSCPLRGNRPLPAHMKRGRKVHACDTCSRTKVSCDSKIPCTRCSSRNLNCTYRRLCNDPTHLANSIIGQELLSRDKNRNRLSFMLACTDPCAGPVDEVLITREPKDEAFQAPILDTPANLNPIADTIDPRVLFLSLIGPSFSTDLDFDDLNDAPERRTQDRLSLDKSDQELQELVSILAFELHQIAGQDTHLQSCVNTSCFDEFFTVPNFRDCIKVFFQREQLLATVIHGSTFRPNHVDPTLLLAVVVAGSVYLHYRQGSVGFTSFLLTLRAIAEKFVFQSVEELVGSTYEASSDAQRTLEICQAAYIVVTLQFCVKDVNIRQRLVTKCHPTLVDLLRNRKMTGTRHSAPGSEQSWHTFVYKESCIRLVHWVFINDAWFTLFSNHPPAMTFLDMSGHLPCRDELWNADCPEDFMRVVSQEGGAVGTPCLKSLMSGLLGEEWTEHTMALYGLLDVKHFLTIIFAFQHVIFHHHHLQTLVSLENSTSVLSRGLERWSELWRIASSRAEIQERNSLGLAKYSDELGFLFRRLIEAGDEESMQLKFLHRSVTYDTASLHQFVQKCAE